jgi:hypothetical protein
LVRSDNRCRAWFAQHAQRVVRGGRKPLQLRAHAAAHIEQEHDVERHVLIAEMPNRLQLTILCKQKVFGLQSGDDSLPAIRHLGVDSNQRHVAAEHGFLGRGSAYQRENRDRRSQRTRNAQTVPLSSGLSSDTRRASGRFRLSAHHTKQGRHHA